MLTFTLIPWLYYRFCTFILLIYSQIKNFHVELLFYLVTENIKKWKMILCLFYWFLNETTKCLPKFKCSRVWMKVAKLILTPSHFWETFTSQLNSKTTSRFLINILFVYTKSKHRGEFWWKEKSRERDEERERNNENVGELRKRRIQHLLKHPCGWIYEGEVGKWRANSDSGASN